MQISRMAIIYESQGAEEAEKKDTRVRQSLTKTAKRAKSGAVDTMRWMDANKTALIAIGTATAALLAGIIRASPTLSAELASVRMAFSMLAFEIGEVLAPAFILLEEWAWKLSDGFAALPKSVKVAIAVTIALTGVLALLLIGIVAVAVAAPMIAAAGITAGMVAQAAAVVLLIGILAGLESKYGILAGVIDVVKTAADVLLGALVKVAGWIVSVGTTVLQGFAALFKMVFNTIKAVVATAVLLVYFLLTGQFGKIGELFMKFGERIIEIWGGTWDKILAALKFVGGKLLTFFSELPGKIYALLKKIATIGFWTELFSNIVTMGEKLVRSILQGIGDVGKKVWNYFKEKMSYFTSRLVAWSKGEIGMSPTLIQIGKAIVDALISGMGNVGQKIWDAMKGKMSVLKEGFKKLTADAKSWGGDFAKNFSDGVGTIESAGKGAIKSVSKHLSFDRRENDMMVFKWGMDAAKFMMRGISTGFAAFNLANTPVTNAVTSPAAMGSTASTTNVITIESGAFVLSGMETQTMDEDRIVDILMDRIESRLGGRY